MTGLSQSKLRVLVAEDSPGIARVLDFTLRHHGFDVTLCRDGLEAWQHAQREEFDLVLMDEQMPRMSGCELCRHLRSQPNSADVPVILLSAKSLELNRQMLKNELGINVVFPKPFSPAELIEAIGQILPQRLPVPS